MIPSIIAIALGMGGQAIPGNPLEPLVVRRVGSLYEISRQGGEVFHSTRARVSNARMINLPGSPAKVALWNEGVGRATVPYFGVSLDGLEFQRVTNTDYRIMLRYAEFDPLSVSPTIPNQLKSSARSQVFIVQFVSQPLEEYRVAIRDVGGEILNYLHHHAYICHMTEAAAASLRQLPFVRWVGRYEPAFRLDEKILAQIAEGSLRTGPYFIQMLGDDVQRKRLTALQIAALGGTVHSAPDEGMLIEATLTPTQLLAVADLDGVLWIEPWSAPEPDMDNVRVVAGANYVDGFGPYRGDGVRVHVIDSGVRATHQAFAGRLTIRTNSSDTSHGTSTTGCVGGSGAGNPAGMGIMPNCNLVFHVYSTSWTTAQRLAITQDTVNLFECVVETNSWGNPQTTQYTSVSAMMDEIIFKTDLLILNSQSNTGNQNSRPQAWAKNIVGVGGISHYNNTILSDDQWTSASIGPAADGRLKPDMSFYYDAILCPSNTNDTSYTSSFGGTSAATPMTAGCFGIFHEMWHKGQFYNSAMGATVFANRPKATLAKAFMIATARQYPFSGTGANLSRYKQGWGLPNLQKLYDDRTKAFYVNETDVLQNLESKTYRLHVPPGTPQLNVAMAYNDYWGTTSATLHRINAIGIKVTSPSNIEYYGNNGLAAGNFSTAGGTWNTVDNVQCVIVNAPQTGTWTIEVRALELNVDGRVETPEIDADYSLVVVGVSPWATLSSITTNFGSTLSGSLTDVMLSDNSRYRVRNAAALALGMAEARVTTTAVSPTATASQIDIAVEHRVTTIGVPCRLSAYNFATNQYDVLSTITPAAGSDTLQTVSITNNASHYIDPSSREIRIRTEYFGDYAVTFTWNAEIDQVRIQVQP